MKHLSPLAALSLVLLLTPALPSHADGFRNPPEGAAAIGAFGGHRAFADDANAVIHNPANLADLPARQVRVNLLGGDARNTFAGAGADRTEDPLFALPGLSLAVPFPARGLALGFSLYVPYGRSVDWGDDGFFAGANLPYAGLMTVADATPVLAWRCGSRLRLAVGADFYYGRVEQRIIFTDPVASMLGLPAGAESRLEADGEGYGGNAALTWHITSRQRLATTYRSAFAIDYQGDNRLVGLGRTDIEGTIDYPGIAALAYGVAIGDTLRAELNVEWLEFSTYRQLVITDENGGTSVTPQNLRDTWTVGLGMAWRFQPAWTARCGLMYLENPTPDETYSPLNYDEDQEVLSVGLGYARARHALDLGYAIGLFDGRTVRGSVNSPDGRYEYRVQLLGLTYGYAF